MRPQRLIPAALCAALVAAAPAWAELAAGDASSLSSQYAAWAGSKSWTRRTPRMGWTPPRAASQAGERTPALRMRG